MKNKILIIVFTVGILPIEAVELNKPNVLLILIDDFGWMDVGYNGSTYYETPNLDTLSKEFLRFDKCYTPSPMSSPTRASIMLGQNPARHGITQWLPGSANWPKHDNSQRVVICPPPAVQALPSEDITLGEAMQDAGYETSFFGKWHMGKFNITGGPTAHGFDYTEAVIEENRCGMIAPFADPSLYPMAKKGDCYTDLNSTCKCN